MGYSGHRIGEGMNRYTTILPVALWLIAFVALPMLLVVFVSFASRDPYGAIVYSFSWDNYVRMFDPLYLRIVWISLSVSGITTFICLFLAYPFSYMLVRSSKKWQTLLLMCVIVPFWTNSLVRTYAWIAILRTEGVINSYLMALGWIAEPLTLLYNNTSILIGLVYTLFPFMVLPLYSSLEKVDRSITEAAYDLGANRITTMFRVVIPLTRPGIIVGCILVFVPALGYFFIPDLMGGGKTMYLSNLIKNQFLQARDWPFGAALSLVLIVVTVIFMFLQMKFAEDEQR